MLRSPLLAALYVALCPAPHAQTAPPTPPLTPPPPDALARARQYSQQVYTADINARLAHEDAVQAKTALLPAITAQSGFIYTQPNGTASGVFVPNDGPRVYSELANVHGEIFNPGKRADYHRALAAEAQAKARSDIATR